MEPPKEETYKIIYENEIKEIKVQYEDIQNKILKNFLEEQGIFKEFEIEPEMIEIKNNEEQDILNKTFDGYGLRDENKNIVLNLTKKNVEEDEEVEDEKVEDEKVEDEKVEEEKVEDEKVEEEKVEDEKVDEKVEELIEELKDQELLIDKPKLVIDEIKDYDKMGKVPYYILNDRNKFFNWVYPTFEETSYKYIENTEKLKEIGFNEKQGQLFTKQFLVDSPYRGILLYHGLGTGKTCAGLITSENLIKKKHTLILTPASLRQTWIDELKFCGDPIYKKNTELIYKNYTFINYNSTDIKKIYSDIKNNIYLDSKVSFKKSEGEILNGRVIEITKGVFKKNIYNPTHVRIIDNENETREYNIKEAEIKLIDNSNPFDNKIIIFDEVHNFIVTIANIYKKMQRPTEIQQMKKDIYDDLKNAINCKIILLSGTPIVNNVHEISFLSNILNGNNFIYKYDYILTENLKKINIQKIEEGITKKINFINYVNTELNQTKLSLNFMFNPDYFVNRNHYEIHKEEDNLEINTIEKKIEKLRTEIEINLKSYKPIRKSIRKLHLDARVMPTNSEMFEKLFLEKVYDTEYRTYIYKSIKNINSIKSLLAGKISYLRGDLPTKTIINTIKLPMGNLQESQYVIARSREIISSRRKKQQDDENLSNLRSKSRQICNIFIPTIHKINELNIEENIEEDESLDDEDEQDDTQGKKNKKEKKIDPRNKNVIDFIDEKIHNKEDQDGDINNIILENIKEYSCKCEHIIRVIIETTKKHKTINNIFYPMGKVLIYSDFRELYSGGVSFIAKLLEIPDFEYIDFNNILEQFLIELDDEEKKIYEGANWGGGEDNSDNINFQNKLLDFLKVFNSKMYHYKTFYLWHTSDTQHMKVNYLAKFVYNHIDNLRGSLLRIMFITKSGSEGISFKTIRQVHILEPFWQQTRETQVIGRAVRYKSHDELPEKDRNVYIYKYLATLNHKKSSVYKDLSVDKNLTTDEYITEVSEKKQAIINTFYELIKQVSVDCPYNNETLTCFSYNNINYYENENEKPIIFNDGISTYNIDILRKEAYLVKKNNQLFIVYNNNLYDYDKYSLHNTLIKIGHVKKTGEDLIFEITRDYSARETCFIQSEIDTGLKKRELENINYHINQGEEITDTEKITFISFTELKGGSNFSDTESDEENFSTDYDSESDEYIEEDFEDDIDIKIKEKIFINNTLYENGDYICLEDKITTDKILIGVITGITNKYIDISEIRIPILENTEQTYLILYKVIKKQDFINNLGLRILEIYVNFDPIYKIYDSYIKNSHITNLINNIYLKLKKYKAPPQSEVISIETKQSSEFIEELSSELNEKIKELTDKSIHLSDLKDLSISLQMSGLEDDLIDPKKINKEDYRNFKEKYIILINLYYELYKNYIIKKYEMNKSFTFFNNNLFKIIKKNNINKLKTSPEIFSKLIETLFYKECSFNTQQTKKNKQADRYKDLTQEMLKNTKTQILMNGIKYNKFIDIIKNDSIHNLIEDTNKDTNEKDTNEKDTNEEEATIEEEDTIEEEEESQDYTNVCDELEIMINNYKTAYYLIDDYPLEIDIIEQIWCLQAFIITKNYDISDVETLLFNDTDIIEEMQKQNTIFIKEINTQNTKELAEKNTELVTTETKKTKKTKKTKEVKEAKETKETKETKEAKETKKKKEQVEQTDLLEDTSELLKKSEKAGKL